MDEENETEGIKIIEETCGGEMVTSVASNELSLLVITFMVFFPTDSELDHVIRCDELQPMGH